MTGPEHYCAAERLLKNAVHHTTEDPADMRIAEVSAATAQVHATLAQAAAVGLLGHSANGMHEADYHAWDDVAGVQA